MSKAPKWREKWAAFVGDKKFLRIKHWEKYQTKFTTQYIYDYVDKEWVDEDYGTAPELCRYIIDGMRRMRGRLRQNLSTTETPELVCSGLRITPKNRHNVPTALLELARRGFLIPTNEPDRDSASDKRRGEESKQNNNVVDEVVNQEEQDQKPTQSAKSSIPPVHPKKEQSRPAPAAPECNHWPRCANGKGPCKTTATPPASPRPAKKLGFDPYSIEPFGDWTADEIHLVVCYWWEYAKNHWYRDNVNRPDYFREKFAKMASEMPRNWQPPKKSNQPTLEKPKANPDCQTCHGKGVYKIDKPGYPKGMFFQDVFCSCAANASISPVQT